MRDGLLAFSTAAGLVVKRQMLDAELASIVGAKHAKLGDDRVGNWHGTATGQMALGGRTLSVERPRGCTVDSSEPNEKSRHLPASCEQSRSQADASGKREHSRWPALATRPG